MGFGSTGQMTLVALAAAVLAHLSLSGSTLGELELAMAKPFGPVGAL